LWISSDWISGICKAPGICGSSAVVPGVVVPEGCSSKVIGFQVVDFRVFVDLGVMDFSPGVVVQCCGGSGVAVQVL
jgi:hypothetical protein